MERIINRITKAIKNGKFNFERVQNKGTYYNYKCIVEPLFCPYGQIGYTIYTDFGEIQYDYELNNIKLK